MIILHGTTRIVIIIGNLAFKIPTIWGWEYFLKGLIGNIKELKISRMRLPEYCPIKFHIPGGFLNIMPKCDAIDRDTFLSLNISDLTENTEMFNCIVENKQDSFGLLNGCIVAVDYAY